MALREFGFPWVPLSLVLAFAGFADAFKRDSNDFLVSPDYRDRRFGLCPQLRNCGRQRCAHLPTFISIAIAAGLGIRWLVQRAVSKSLPGVKHL